MIMVVFRRIDRRIRGHSKYIRLYLNFSSNKAMTDFMKRCREQHLKVMDIQISKIKNDSKGGVIVFVTVMSDSRYEHSELVERLSAGEGVRHIEEV